MSYEGFTIASNRVVWQVSLSHQPAWSFDDEGHCQLAFDPLSALREVVGPGVAQSLLSPRFVAERRLRRMSPPRVWWVAEVERPPAAEQSSDLRARGFDGAQYEVADAEPGGLTIFGQPGERSGWRRGPATVLPRKVLGELEESAGVRVAPVPSLAQLRVMDG